MVEVLEFSKFKVKLPSGKEVGVIDALTFCYGLSDTDVEVLKVLMEKENATEDDVSDRLGLSKASVNRSLNKLMSIGFIERERGQTPKMGRPRYVYKTADPNSMLERIKGDFHECARLFSSVISSLLKKGD